MPGETPPPAADAAGTGTSTPSADAPAAVPTAGADAQRWQDTFKRINALEHELKAARAPVPKADPPPEKKGSKDADAFSELQALRGELALKDAIVDSGLKLSPEQRGVVTRLYTAERPQDVSEWLKSTTAVFTVETKVPETPAATPPPNSNTGAPASNGRAFVAHDPFALPPGAFSALPREEQDKLWSGYKKNHGYDTNPFAARRKK